MFLALIGLIPGALSFAQGITTAIFNAKVKIMQARIGGDEVRATQIVSLAATEAHEHNTWLSIIASNPLLTWLVIFFASPFVIFIWKVVVVDIVIGPGCIWLTHVCWIGDTDPIKGQVAEWGNSIIWSIFGSSTTLAVGKMIMANRSDKDTK